MSKQTLMKKRHSTSLIIIIVLLCVLLTLGVTVTIFFMLPSQSAFGLDTDGDGVADIFDPDDDNDGVPDVMDPDPLDPDVPDDDDTDDDDDDDTDDEDDDDEDGLIGGWFVLQVWFTPSLGFRSAKIPPPDGPAWEIDIYFGGFAPTDLHQFGGCDFPEDEESPYAWMVYLHKNTDGSYFDVEEDIGELCYDFDHDIWVPEEYSLYGYWYTGDPTMIVFEEVNCVGCEGHFVACDVFVFEDEGGCWLNTFTGWMLPLSFSMILFISVAIVIILFVVVFAFLVYTKRVKIKHGSIKLKR